MATDSTKPKSLSSFLRSYSQDSFEWESPGYCPRTRFLWSKPLGLVPHGSSSRPLTGHDTSQCDGPSSPCSESLADMSVSLADVGHAHTHHFSILPPMIRVRTTSNAAGRPTILRSNSSSLSDMSISFPTASSSSVTLEDFENFVANVPTQTSHGLLLPDDLLSCLPQALGPDAHTTVIENDDGLDPAAVSRILEWTASLFTSVANSVLSYSIQPGVDDLPKSSRSNCTSTRIILEDGTVYFSTLSKNAITESWSSPAMPVVKLNSAPPIGSQQHILANPKSILMPGAIDSEAINPEQPTTTKPVCMWGRRLERIPKVRLAGQKEAVYCFDARKQRQKQKDSLSLADHHAVGSSRSEYPTQIFYRARPLCAPFVRRDLPATPVDAVKITQGQVLLQTVNPVRFDFATSQSFNGAQRSFQRLPLSTRTNGPIHNRYSESISPSMILRRIPGSGFL